MRLVETYSSDALDNVVFDAALFDAVEAGTDDETFRLWETAQPAVVMGRFGVAGREINEHVCHADDVPVIRRSSGGGAVVIGPGCFNYSYMTSLDARPALRDVTHSYQAILGRIIEALGISGLHVAGGSDVALGDRKVGGSAQRRGRRALLHHGTVLYAFDSSSMARWLKQPLREPLYRGGRCHAAFVSNLPLARAAIRDAFVRAFASRARAGEPAWC